MSANPATYDQLPKVYRRKVDERMAFTETCKVTHWEEAVAGEETE